MSDIERIDGGKEGSVILYRLATSRVQSSNINTFIATTPETRAICNDPLVYGYRYTESLKDACKKTLIALKEKALINPVEKNSSVLHVLRGGLNFGLREALAEGFKWNNHNSIFISAQRVRDSVGGDSWHITESDYRKIQIKEDSDIIFGDVVATGTSLKHALREIVAYAKDDKKQIRSLLFFTFGAAVCEEIAEEISEICQENFNTQPKITVVYFEGVFNCASDHSKQQVKITGTDLLRSPAVLAPEFIESQYEKSSYPLERCTIYDAGSRAFWIPEYFEDVHEYWSKTLELAKSGVSFESLLCERFPELDVERFAKRDLVEICRAQIDAVSSIT